MLFFSCHSDTNFINHTLTRFDNGTIKGFLDNFAGVYALMKAYFSGRISNEYTHIELTYGEENGFIGAKKLAKVLKPDDVVIVIDVTGTYTQKSFTIEKCKNNKLKSYIIKSLSGLSYDLYEDCPDPISDADEVDIYTRKCKFTCFLGIPVTKGDYNQDQVFCQDISIESVSEAICRISQNFNYFN